MLTMCALLLTGLLTACGTQQPQGTESAAETEGMAETQPAEQTEAGAQETVTGQNTDPQTALPGKLLRPPDRGHHRSVQTEITLRLHGRRWDHGGCLYGKGNPWDLSGPEPWIRHDDDGYP